MSLRVSSRVKAVVSNGSRQQQTPEATGTGRTEPRVGVLRRGDRTVVQGLPEGRAVGQTHHRRVQEDLRQLLPVRRRVRVCRACVPHVRQRQQQLDRLPGVHMCAERYLARQTRGQTQVGIQHVRLGRRRKHFKTRDARDRHGNYLLLFLVLLGCSILLDRSVTDTLPQLPASSAVISHS